MSEVTRRGFLQGSALVGFSAFLAACGAKGTATSEPSSATPTEAPSASATPAASVAPTPEPTLAAEVNWANWSYYMDYDEKTKTFPTIEDFKKKYGTTIKYQEVVEGNDEFFGTIQGPLQAKKDTGWDIITLTDWMASRIIRLGWAEKLDLGNMPNFTANLIDSYKNMDWDPTNDHHAPWQSGFTGLGFDPAKVGNVTSTKSLYTSDPRWNKKVEILSEMRDAIGLTMLLDGDDPTKPTRDACDKAVAVIKKAQDDGILRDVKGQSYTEDLKSGDAVLAMAWGGDILQAQIDKPGLKFNVPDEGGMIWTDNSMIPLGAAHKFTAEKVIDYYYDPKVAATVEAYVNYLCPVKGADEAMKAIDPEIANNPLIFPPEDVRKKLYPFGALNEDDEKYFNDQFATIQGVG